MADHGSEFRRVPSWFCPGCRHYTTYKPCVLCTARRRQSNSFSAARLGKKLREAADEVAKREQATASPDPAHEAILQLGAEIRESRSNRVGAYMRTEKQEPYTIPLIGMSDLGEYEESA